MPQIELNITLELPQEQIEAVSDTLGCAPADLETHLAPYAEAAVREYAEMLSGEAMTSVTDLRERRLAAILTSLPADEFPSDEQIARLYSLTSSQGRGLLRSTVSRHRNRVKDVMDAAARRFIDSCEETAEAGKRQARCPNAIIIDLLNAQLAAASQQRTPIRRKSGTFDTYVVSTGAYNELQALYP
jgi:hypothetical protein